MDRQNGKQNYNWRPVYAPQHESGDSFDNKKAAGGFSNNHAGAKTKSGDKSAVAFDEQGGLMPKKHKSGRKSGISLDKKRRWEIFRKLYSPLPIISGFLTGIIIAALLVAGIAVADLRGRLGGANKFEFKANSVQVSMQKAIINQPSRSKSPEEVKAEQQTINRESAPVMHDIDNYLVCGVDSRAGDFNGRSDTMILVSINHKLRRISLVSFFRAAYVNIPDNGWFLLNASYSWGGPELLINTIEQNFQIPIMGFVAINFASFSRIIDLVGGVPLYLTEDEAYAIGSTPGNVWADGDLALRYARLRKIDTDFNRMERQRNVMEAVMSQLQNSGATTIYNVATEILPWVWTNIDVNSMVGEIADYLSYDRQSMQIPRTEDMYMFYTAGGSETWGFDLQQTGTLLYDYLTNP